MINTKSGPIYTLCLDCFPLKDPISAANEEREPCDACGRTTKVVTWLDYLPKGKHHSSEPAVIAARAIIRGMDKHKVKIPRVR